MSENVSNTQPTVGTTPSVGSVASKNAPASYTMDTQIDSVESLKEKAPEVYQKMLEGVAQNIIGKMRKQQERLKKLMREGYSR